MGAKMEVLPNSLLKRRGSSTATWGGGTLGRVGGRRRQRSASTEPRLVGHLHQLLFSQVCNNIKQSNLWSANITSCFSHRFATTSSSPTCGRPSHQQLLTQRRRCPRSWPCHQGHGGVFGLGTEGPEDDGGEGNLGRVEKNTKRAESNLAPP